MASIAWLSEHWFTVLSVTVYLIANVVPRPTGHDLTGPVKVFWEIIDRLCFFTAHGLPGNVKLPMTRTLGKKTSSASEEASEPESQSEPTEDKKAKPRKKGHGG